MFRLRIHTYTLSLGLHLVAVFMQNLTLCGVLLLVYSASHSLSFESIVIRIADGNECSRHYGSPQ